ncbi:glycine cleavage system H-like protein gcvH4 [Vespa velutina]|uniref:glycine cleavage system H-like protein gcvH4 n=1 Tax=Vespa velutina TaxID=202808 RepID=UPI001FB45122|nr:glycine cleavage system H-like protein gcvH4 [Vespa velutina]
MNFTNRFFMPILILRSNGYNNNNNNNNNNEERRNKIYEKVKEREYYSYFRLTLEQSPSISWPLIIGHKETWKCQVLAVPQH